MLPHIEKGGGSITNADRDPENVSVIGRAPLRRGLL